jgi:hypothetical protein
MGVPVGWVRTGFLGGVLGACVRERRRQSVYLKGGLLLREVGGGNLEHWHSLSL